MTPPPVVFDKDGNKHKAPKYCTSKDLEKLAKDIAEATKAATKMKQAAGIARAAAVLARKQALKMNPLFARITNEVARGLDVLANLLEKQAKELLDKASEKKCVDAPVSGGRF